MVVDVKNASRGDLASARVNGRSSTVIPCDVAYANRRWRVMLFKMAFSTGLVMRLPAPSMIQALVEPPSVPKPPGSICQDPNAPFTRATCLTRTFGNNAMDLMSQRSQRISV